MQEINGNVGVSVICTTYNHEPYIAACLSGFISQKTTFKFQVIVHDDASTDNTAQIINDYATKYPNIIIPFIEKENKYSKHIPFIKDILPLVTGKYIAFCEGDDFWSSEFKLQKQYEAMEKHNSCSICVHKVQCIHENGLLLNRQYPGFALHSDEISPADFFSLYSRESTIIFQLSSYFLKANIYKDYINNPPEFKIICNVGDTPLLCFFATKGYIYYIPELLSCYRVMSLNSWSHRNSNCNSRIILNENMIAFDNALNEYTNFVYNDYMQLSIKRRKFLIAQYKNDYKMCLSKELKDAYKIMPLRIRFSAFLRCYFPIVSKIIMIFFKKKKGH